MGEWGRAEPRARPGDGKFACVLLSLARGRAQQIPPRMQAVCFKKRLEMGRWGAGLAWKRGGERKAESAPDGLSPPAYSVSG
jgi:hypothetical protein